MRVRKVYQLILIFVLNFILLISRDREITIYFCAVINILFWSNNRRYLKYSVEKWNLQNLIIFLFKISTIIYLILIFSFLIDFNAIEGLLIVAVIVGSEVQLFIDRTIPRGVLYIYFIFIFYLKFEGFVDFLLGGIGFQFLFDIFYSEEFIDYIVCENKNISNKEYLYKIKEKIKDTREKIKIRLSMLTIAFVIFRYIDEYLFKEIITWIDKKDGVFDLLMFYYNIIKFVLATGMAIGLDLFICSKIAAYFINKKQSTS